MPISEQKLSSSSTDRQFGHFPTASGCGVKMDLSMMQPVLQLHRFHVLEARGKVFRVHFFLSFFLVFYLSAVWLSILDYLICNPKPNHSRDIAIRSERIRNVFSITMNALDDKSATWENPERCNVVANLFGMPSLKSKLHFLSLLLLISTLYQRSLSPQ